MTLLHRVADGELDAVTSAEVIQEILHRYSALRQPAIGTAMARGALDLFAPVIPITHATMRRVPDLVERHPGLAARDLVHVATCQAEGITEIVSPDGGFDEIPDIHRLDPVDL